MSSQGRSAGAAVCIALAITSVITAVILSAVALTASSHVADEPLDRFHSTIDIFKDADCDTGADSPPDQVFLACFSEHESTVQEDAARWGTEVAARQADVQAKGNLAIVFGLLGVTFAACAAASNRGGRTVPHTTDPAATGPAPGGALAPAPPPSQP